MISRSLFWRLEHAIENSPRTVKWKEDTKLMLKEFLMAEMVVELPDEKPKLCVDCKKPVWIGNKYHRNFWQLYCKECEIKRGGFPA